MITGLDQIKIILKQGAISIGAIDANKENSRKKFGLDPRADRRVMCARVTSCIMKPQKLIWSATKNLMSIPSGDSLFL